MNKMMHKEQMDLIHSNAFELEQALETLQTLKPDERSDYIKRWPSTLQSICELMRITLEGQKVGNAMVISEALATTLSTYLGGRDLFPMVNASRMPCVISVFGVNSKVTT